MPEKKHCIFGQESPLDGCDTCSQIASVCGDAADAAGSSRTLRGNKQRERLVFLGWVAGRKQDVHAVKEAMRGVEEGKVEKRGKDGPRAAGRLYSGRAKRRGASRGRVGATKPGGENRDTEIIDF